MCICANARLFVGLRLVGAGCIHRLHCRRGARVCATVKPNFVGTCTVFRLTHAPSRVALQSGIRHHIPIVCAVPRRGLEGSQLHSALHGSLDSHHALHGANTYLRLSCFAGCEFGLVSVWL